MAKKKESYTESSSTPPGKGSASKEASAPVRWVWKGPVCLKYVIHGPNGGTYDPVKMMNDEKAILAFQKKHPERADLFVKE